MKLTTEMLIKLIKEEKSRLSEAPSWTWQDENPELFEEFKTKTANFEAAMNDLLEFWKKHLSLEERQYDARYWALIRFMSEWGRSS